MDYRIDLRRGIQGLVRQGSAKKGRVLVGKLDENHKSGVCGGFDRGISL